MSIRRLIKSFPYAFRGIAKALAREQNLRIEALIGLLVVGMGLALGISALEWAILILAMGLVLALELANTALEAAVELSVQGFHPLAGLAKDAAAGAVLVASLVAALAGLFILGPHLLGWLR